MGACACVCVCVFVCVYVCVHMFVEGATYLRTLTAFLRLPLSNLEKNLNVSGWSFIHWGLLGREGERERERERDRGHIQSLLC